MTICTWNRECLFGDIVEGGMIVNEYGNAALNEWVKTADIRPNVELDYYVIMPNHLHGVLMINYVCNAGRGVLQYAPTRPTLRSPSQTIGAIVRGFKSAVTKTINDIRDTPGVPVRQRNYYEHVIRNDDELNRIREYVVNNPARWEEDENNPEKFIKADTNG